MLNTIPFDVATDIFEAKARDIKIYPCNANRASEIGHPCERYLVHSRRDWDKKMPHSVDSQLIFDEGNDIEKRAIQDLIDAGYRVWDQQKSFKWDEFNLTGHIDITISKNGSDSYPCEIKSINANDFGKINSVDDLMNSKKVWLRKYPAQLMSYMVLTNKETGCFYLKNKQNYQPKFIWVNLDYVYMEEILKKIERINKYVAEGTYPDSIEYEENTCGYCAFKHICLPDTMRKELEFVDNAELEEKLNRWNELKSYKKEYDELDKEISEAVKEKNLSVGNFLISGKWIEKQMPATEAKIIKYWQKKIVNI